MKKIQLFLRYLLFCLAVYLLASSENLFAENIQSHDLLEQAALIESKNLGNSVVEIEACIDPQPQGKKIRQIAIVTLPPFAFPEKSEKRSQKILRVVSNMGNKITWITNDKAVWREMIIKEGDEYDQTIVDENIKKIFNIIQWSEAAIYPVCSPVEESSAKKTDFQNAGNNNTQTYNPKEVDILVIVRDLFPYQLNFSFKKDNFGWQFEPTFVWRNAFGLRKEFEYKFIWKHQLKDMLLIYRDPRVANSKWFLDLVGHVYWQTNENFLTPDRSTFEVAAQNINNSEITVLDINKNRKFDGFAAKFNTGHLFEDKYDLWQWEIGFNFDQHTYRTFEDSGTVAIAFDNNGSMIPQDIISNSQNPLDEFKDIYEFLPRAYTLAKYRGKIGGERRIGLDEASNWNVNLGAFYRFNYDDINFYGPMIDVLPKFPATVSTRNESYAAQVFPVVENSLLGVKSSQSYRSISKFQNLDFYGRDEYIDLGYEIGFEFSRAQKELFSTYNYWNLLTTLEYALGIPGVILIRGSHTSEFRFGATEQGKRGIHQLSLLNLIRSYLYLGEKGGVIATQLSLNFADKYQPLEPFKQGGNLGLRGFTSIYGNRSVYWSVEYRSPPLISSGGFFFGLAAFYDAGFIWSDNNSKEFRHGTGLGPRIFWPSLSKTMISIDTVFRINQVYNYKVKGSISFWDMFNVHINTVHYF